MAPKAKKAAPTVSKAQKVPIKAKAHAKSTTKAIPVVLIKEVVTLGVVVVNQSGRTIT